MNPDANVAKKPQLSREETLREKFKYLKKLESKIGRTGYGQVCLFRCLLLQYMEDLSDRQLEEFLSTNNVAKWCCGFGLIDKTPDHSLFSLVRKRIGTKQLSKFFNIMRDQLIARGCMRKVFSFVDSSHLIAKNILWRAKILSVGNVKTRRNSLGLGSEFFYEELLGYCKRPN